MPGAHFADLYVDTLQRALPLDLADVPVYIVLAGDCPGAEAHGDARAYAGTYLDLELQPYLEERGRWQGRGMGIVICDRSLLGSTEIDGILLHEASHWFEGGRAATKHEDPADWPQEIQFLQGIWTRPRPVEPADPPALKPWHRHEQRFIRAAIHVGFRAWQAGVLVGLDEMIIAGGAYGLANVEAYARALGTEPIDRANEPLLDVLADSSPATFLDFWFEDLENATAHWDAST